MKIIPLNKGYSTIVDDDDYQRLVKFKWQCSAKDGLVYAVRKTSKNVRRITIFMHREIVGAKKGDLVDHQNGNGLHNVRGNLRVCDAAQNIWNSKKKSNGKSKHKGVIYLEKRKKWRACITFRFRDMCIGYYETEDDAGVAYYIAAQLFYGEFARLNDV